MKILKVRKIDANWDGMELWEICRELNDKAPKDPKNHDGGVIVQAPMGKGDVKIYISTVGFMAVPDRIEEYAKFLNDCVKYAKKCYQDLKKAGFEVKYGPY